MTLAVIAFSPPLGRDPRETTTWKSANVAAAMLGSSDLLIVNLLAAPTQNLLDANRCGAEATSWREARPALMEALKQPTLLAAWGLGGLTGPARAHFRQQVEWLCGEAIRSGHERWWQVGGQPRHPSRWRQFAGPQRGIACGDGFEARLRSVLVEVPIRQ